MTTYTKNPSTSKAEGEVLQVDNHVAAKTKEKNSKLHLYFSFCLFYWSFAYSVWFLWGLLLLLFKTGNISWVGRKDLGWGGNDQNSIWKTLTKKEQKLCPPSTLVYPVTSHSNTFKDRTASWEKPAHNFSQQPTTGCGQHLCLTLLLYDQQYKPPPYLPWYFNMWTSDISASP